MALEHKAPEGMRLLRLEAKPKEKKSPSILVGKPEVILSIYLLNNLIKL